MSVETGSDKGINSISMLAEMRVLTRWITRWIFSSRALDRSEERRRKESRTRTAEERQFVDLKAEPETESVTGPESESKGIEIDID
ncbi:hypothetical protein EVAR_4714_1 [Eumeta japonica]|uniref:Uncharacterized protein n=1 Tax=Eumeta variegata TaxID=151549 RepID=A0A4C1ZZ56_EUMVA|nr:hypothetical protein EVAR_4714_1 [Eumeta japonica]